MIDYTASDGFCTLTLNAPPVNTITFALLDELRASIERACTDPEVQAIVITGSAEHFSAGADVKIFRKIATADAARDTSRIFQDAFQAVEDSTKPVAAAVSGKMMGSALELAMACHFRACSADTRFSMPEVNLGINPGAAGTQRLPRLVGAEKALEMLLTGKVINAEEARRIGLVDAVCGSAELVTRARELLRSGAAPVKTSESFAKIGESGVNEAAFEKAREILAKTRPELIAPFGILEAVSTGIQHSFRAGLLKEQEVFARCMETPATRNKIYTFFATRETSKAPDLEGIVPDPIGRAAVIGMGSMGTGIAHALMAAGVPVVVRDEDQAVLDKGSAAIARSLAKRVSSGRLSRERADAMLALLSTTTEWSRIADAGLVIEAVFEDLAVKRSVIGKLEEVCAREAIIASNTSTLSLDALAEGMRNPERLAGLHFFNPAQRMPLVEVVRRDATPCKVVATALAFTKRIRKTPVLVRNREGFIVNRMFVPYLNEAFRLLEDGADPQAVDAAMVDFGFAMGPFVLIDMAGLDILAFTVKLLERAFPNHDRLSGVVSRLVDRGALGQKTGSGVYRYEKGDRTPHRSDTTAQVIDEVRREKGLTPREVGSDEVTQRLILRMVNEAFFIMEEGIAQRESDVDAAMVLATGFPDFRGGIVKYARDLGLDIVLTQLDKLTQSLGQHFKPCGLLKRKKGSE